MDVIHIESGRFSITSCSEKRISIDVQMSKAGATVGRSITHAPVLAMYCTTSCAIALASRDASPDITGDLVR